MHVAYAGRSHVSWDPVTDTNSIVSGVAQRYASALFELALEGGALDAVSADLDALEGVIAGSDDLGRLVRSPVFTSDEQVRAITAVLDKTGIGGLAANLVKVAAKNRRLFSVPDMIKGYRVLLAAHRGETRAEVTSAEALKPEHVAALKDALSGAAGGKDVIVETKVDASLIGGLIVKIGSRMIDASLKTKLATLKVALKEVR
ncbi:MAG: F0F1 ATP synthase subunit delta [Hyphomicrobiaceae bacterium]|nr:F0F1 ATP synthase subunit delta [Hyphomicrobiaceae bacterium]